MKGTGAMFGKTEWFQPKVRGWGLRPKSWQGWLYALAWGAVISLPFCALVTLGRVPEAAIWVLATGMLLVWDVRQIRAGTGKKSAGPPPALVSEREERERPEIQFLDEPDGGAENLDTRGFHMSLRDRS